MHLRSSSVAARALSALPLTVLLTWLPAATVAQAQGFKFSQEDPAQQAEKAAAAERQARVQAQLTAPCRAKIKDQKIVVLIGEERNGAILASQASYNTHINAINQRLQSLGLKTYSPEEIRKQIAQAEINAYFRNDPDAAISASRRLAAQYILRGLIATQTTRNPVVNVNQVIIHMDFTLTGANGKMISHANAKNESFAGRDTMGMALTLINERADEVVAQLYTDYCQKAGTK
jgi:hypothetical protein